MLTDVEISRALNALATTMREQRPERFDATRAEQIARGALAGESKLEAVQTGSDSGELRRASDGMLVAVIRRDEGGWQVQRKLRAGESSWALPQPAHDRKQE